MDEPVVKKSKSDKEENVGCIIKNTFLKPKCFEEGYLPEIGWENDNLEYFNLKGLNKVRFKMLSVISGENGTGKSSLLKLLRQKIIKVYNNPLPKYVVRFLSNGEISDNYDPEKNNHPLIIKERIYKKCEKLIKYKCDALKENDALEKKDVFFFDLKEKREFEKIISRCEDKFGNGIFEENCKRWGDDQHSDESKYFLKK